MTNRNVLISWLSIFVATALTTGCHSRDQIVREALPGTWVATTSYPEGGEVRTITTVARDGSYESRFISSTTTGQLASFHIQGRLEVAGGFLVDTVVRHSDSAVSVPLTVSNRIIRASPTEFAIESPSGAGPVVFLKQKP